MLPAKASGIKSRVELRSKNYDEVLKSEKNVRLC